MKYVCLIVLLMSLSGISQLAPLPPEIKIEKKPQTQVQSDTKQLLIIQRKLKTNYIQFKYPPSVNLSNWHDTRTYVSIDGTNWIFFGKNLIETRIMGPNKLFYKQEIIQ